MSGLSGPWPGCARRCRCSRHRPRRREPMLRRWGLLGWRCSGRRWRSGEARWRCWRGGGCRRRRDRGRSLGRRTLSVREHRAGYRKLVGVAGNSPLRSGRWGSCQGGAHVLGVSAGVLAWGRGEDTELAEGLLDLVVGGVAADSEDFVVVDLAGGHCDCGGDALLLCGSGWRGRESKPAMQVLEDSRGIRVYAEFSRWLLPSCTLGCGK